MATVPANFVFDTLTELATCLCNQVILDDLPELCFCGILPGSLAAYNGGEECDAGMAWVRLITMYPAGGVGQFDTSLTNCLTGLGFDVEVGILRPMPIGGEDGEGPTDAELLWASQVQIADALAMRKAILCCMGDRPMVLGSYMPMGPEGGIVGGTWEINLVED